MNLLRIFSSEGVSLSGVTQSQTRPLLLGRATAMLRKSIFWQETSVTSNKQTEKGLFGMAVANNLSGTDKKQRPNPYVAVAVDTNFEKLIRGQLCYV